MSLYANSREGTGNHLIESDDERNRREEKKELPSKNCSHCNSDAEGEQCRDCLNWFCCECIDDHKKECPERECPEEDR